MQSPEVQIASQLLTLFVFEIYTLHHPFLMKKVVLLSVFPYREGMVYLINL